MARRSMTYAVDYIKIRTGASEYVIYKWLKEEGTIEILPDMKNSNRKLISDEDIERIIALLNTYD